MQGPSHAFLYDAFLYAFLYAFLCLPLAALLSSSPPSHG